MTITLDSVLNFIIPVIVCIFLIYIVLNPFRGPLTSLWNKIKDWREGRKEDEWEMIKKIEYE